jgi:glycosyltransferase 2 family protein
VNARRLLGRALPIAILLVALTIAAIRIAQDRHALVPALRHIGGWAVVASALAAVVGTGVIAELWREVLIGLDARTSPRVAARVFFPSQLGKYLPGSVWPVLAQMEFGRRIGINRRRMFTANAMVLVLNLAVGLVLAGICLPLSSTTGLHRFWWTFLFLPLLVLCLHPRLIPALVDAAFRPFKREPLDARLPVRSSLRASCWGVVSWLGLGAHIYLLARPFGATDFAAFLAAVGGMCLAVAAGILFIPAPAGAGIRDAVLVATLAPTIGATNALAVALVSRVVLIGVDLLLAGFAVLLPADVPTSSLPRSGAT